MNENFSKPLDQFRRTEIRKKFEKRIGKIDISSGSLNKDSAIKKEDKKNLIELPNSEGELNEKEKEILINAILLECDYNPGEVLKKTDKIKDFLPLPKVNAINFLFLSDKANRDFKKATQQYEKELDIIEDLGGDGKRIVMEKNKDTLKATKQRACKMIVEMIRNKSVQEAVAKFKEN